MKTPSQQEMQEFATLARVDIASAYLALPKIRKHGLDLDHPRAAKLARGEMNRSARAEWACGVTMPQRDGRAAVVDADTPATAERGAMQVDESQLAPRFRAKPEKESKKWPMALINANANLTTFAPGQVDEDSENEQRIVAMLELKHQIKPRDKEVLELRFEQGLNIQQVADAVGKTRSAIYATIDKLKTELRDARERKDWGDEHNALRLGTGDAPVVLNKTGQLGWDLGVQS